MELGGHGVPAQRRAPVRRCPGGLTLHRPAGGAHRELPVKGGKGPGIEARPCS